MNNKMNKHADISMTYVFIFSLIVIIALIFVFVKFLPTIMPNDESNMAACISNLKSAFDDVNQMDYNSVMTFGGQSKNSIYCPGYQQICFLESNKTQNLQRLDSSEKDLYDDINAGGKENAALIKGKASYSLYNKLNYLYVVDNNLNGIDDAKDSSYKNKQYVCINITNSHIAMTVRQYGKYLMISPVKN